MPTVAVRAALCAGKPKQGAGTRAEPGSAQASRVAREYRRDSGGLAARAGGPLGVWRTGRGESLTSRSRASPRSPGPTSRPSGASAPQVPARRGRQADPAGHPAPRRPGRRPSPLSGELALVLGERAPHLEWGRVVRGRREIAGAAGRRYRPSIVPCPRRICETGWTLRLQPAWSGASRDLFSRAATRQDGAPACWV